MSKPSPFLLSPNHSVMESYKERITASQWREILLDERDTMIFKGTVRQLVAKNLGYGVVEVSKAPLDKKLPIGIL